MRRAGPPPWPSASPQRRTGPQWPRPPRQRPALPGRKTTTPPRSNCQSWLMPQGQPAPDRPREQTARPTLAGPGQPSPQPQTDHRCPAPRHYRPVLPSIPGAHPTEQVTPAHFAAEMTTAHHRCAEPPSVRRHSHVHHHCCDQPRLRHLERGQLARPDAQAQLRARLGGAVLGAVPPNHQPPRFMGRPRNCIKPRSGIGTMGA